MFPVLNNISLATSEAVTSLYNYNYSRAYHEWLETSWLGTRTADLVSVVKNHDYTQTWKNTQDYFDYVNAYISERFPHNDHVDVYRLVFRAAFFLFIWIVFVTFFKLICRKSRKPVASPRRSRKVRKTPRERSRSPGISKREQKLADDLAAALQHVQTLTRKNNELHSELVRERQMFETKLSAQVLENKKMTSQLKRSVLTKALDEERAISEELAHTVDELKKRLHRAEEAIRNVVMEDSMLISHSSVKRKKTPPKQSRKRVSSGKKELKQAVPTAKRLRLVKRRPRRACAPTTFFDWPDEYDTVRSESNDPDWQPGDA